MAGPHSVLQRGQPREGLGPPTQRADRVDGLFLAPLTLRVQSIEEEHVKPLVLHEDVVELALRGQGGQSGRHVVLGGQVGGLRRQEVLEVAQHVPLGDLLLQLSQSVPHAVLGGLDGKLGVEQQGDATGLEKVRHVVVVVRQPVQREGGVVLGVHVRAPQQLEQRTQSAGLDDASLVVRVLGEPADGKGGHLADLDNLLRQHRDQRAQRPPLHDLGLVVRVLDVRELSQQQGSLPPALHVHRGQQVDQRLQGAAIQHELLDVRRAVNERRHHCNGLVMDVWVARPKHAHQRPKSPALHDLVLVVLVPERDRLERTRGGDLHGEFPRLEQQHQRGDAALFPHQIFGPDVLVSQVGEGPSSAPGDGVRRGVRLRPLPLPLPPAERGCTPEHVLLPKLLLDGLRDPTSPLVALNAQRGVTPQHVDEGAYPAQLDHLLPVLAVHRHKPHHQARVLQDVLRGFVDPGFRESAGLPLLMRPLRPPRVV
mmetsp:Transcript_2328/g.7825  ORF Transcript_2328/g.7825 Transcript_2328/m.7825 type:complete len:482 (+) Transcript_2328:588-2033(+)